MTLLTMVMMQLSPDWKVDYESYGWKKLDPKAPDTLKMIKVVPLFLCTGNIYDRTMAGLIPKELL